VEILQSPLGKLQVATTWAPQVAFAGRYGAGLMNERMPEDVP